MTGDLFDLPSAADAPDRLTEWAPERWPVAAGWAPVVAGFLASPSGRQLGDFMRQRLAAGAVIYPPRPFRALELTAPEQVHAVVLGQDPYHGPGQAEGLAFSVREGVKLPPSLRNIFKELAEDVGVAPPASGDLTGWARQGVLLLNAVLTVRAGAAASHAGKGWETFTDEVIRTVSAKPERVVFILWGGYARKKKALIDTSRHVVIESAHPSPLSAHNGFFGSKPFSRANAALVDAGLPPVEWCLTD